MNCDCIDDKENLTEMIDENWFCKGKVHEKKSKKKVLVLCMCV